MKRGKKQEAKDRKGSGIYWDKSKGGGGISKNWYSIGLLDFPSTEQHRKYD